MSEEFNPNDYIGLTWLDKKYETRKTKWPTNRKRLEETFDTAIAEGKTEVTKDDKVIGRIGKRGGKDVKLLLISYVTGTLGFKEKVKDGAGSGNQQPPAPPPAPPVPPREKSEKEIALQAAADKQAELDKAESELKKASAEVDRLKKEVASAMNDIVQLFKQNSAETTAKKSKPGAAENQQGAEAQS